MVIQVIFGRKMLFIKPTDLQKRMPEFGTSILVKSPKRSATARSSACIKLLLCF